jgi:hypothetical protein
MNRAGSLPARFHAARRPETDSERANPVTYKATDNIIPQSRCHRGAGSTSIRCSLLRSPSSRNLPIMFAGIAPALSGIALMSGRKPVTTCCRAKNKIAK